LNDPLFVTSAPRAVQPVSVCLRDFL